ncbi:hypothetical protein RHSIM_Rhsim10G0194700 [Rhododendron simsii]|uniref:Pentatricopeptide repeat-containing protein n=1 Tax=Rhododendron simsii TaxID=118357 RepID=A0A834LDM8_RHOSS|nr:hypothetical protein RHSIM_Rhsim10G0194700 [Rhododendron simsii]
MPRFSNPSKLTRIYHRLVNPPSQSKSISTTPVPTHDHIAHLILEQKTATQALQTFRWASDLPNFAHSQSTYRALIHKLCTFRRFDTVHQVLDEMPGSIGSPPDEDIFVTLVRGLGRAKMIRSVIKVVDLVSKFDETPSLKIYNSILDVLVKEDIDLARKFYREKMMESGVEGDDYTFGILMKGLCLTNRIDEGFKHLAAMKSRRLIPNTVIYNTLLHALCKNGKVGRARSLMNEMLKPNEVTFNILVSAYCREGNVVQALVMLEKSFGNGCVPDVITVTKVIEILCNEGRVTEAVEVLERVKSDGGSVDVVAYNTLIKGFCKKRKAKIAVGYLKEMERKGSLPNVETYNVLISGFCESGMLDSAMDMFQEMKTAGISWNFVTFDTLVNGLCSGGRTNNGFKILELMEESKGGSGGRISPYNHIIYGLYKENRLNEAFEFLSKMGKLFPRAIERSSRILRLCKEGSIEEAKRVHDQMTEEGGIPSALVYSSLIHGFCQKGLIKEAFELMNEMISRGYFPISTTFNSVIIGLCKEGEIGSAMNLLEDLVGRGCLPNVESYNPLVEALCRKGEFQKALFVFLQMVDKGGVPDFCTWNSLVLCLCQEKMWIEDTSIFCEHNLLE